MHCKGDYSNLVTLASKPDSTSGYYSILFDPGGRHFTSVASTYISTLQWGKITGFYAV